MASQAKTIVLLLVALTTPLPARAAEATRIAVLPPKLLRGVRGVVESAIFNEAMLAAIHNAGAYEVIGHSDINAVLGFERQREVIGCDDTLCFTEIGGALGVDYLMDTKLARFAGRFQVTTKLIKMRGGSPSVVSRRVAQLLGELARRALRYCIVCT